MLLLVLALVAGVQGSPAITVSPLVLATSPGNITLTWSGLSKDTNYSVGLYLHYPGLSHVAGMQIPRGTSSGTMEIPVVNARVGMHLELCDADNCSPKYYVARSQNFTFKSADEPTQGHLALTNSPNELVLMFVTNSDVIPQVLLGTSSGSLTQTLTGTSEAPYVAADMCFAPATDETHFFSPGYQNKVVLSNLKPSHRYYYKFGSKEAWSAEFSFVAPAARSDTISAIVFGDMGVTIPYDYVAGSSYFPAASNVAWMEEQLSAPGTQADPTPSLIVHIGDISYARGYPVTWEWFMTSIVKLATAVPFMIGIGNHEYDYKGHGMPWAPSWGSWGIDSGGECGVPYSSRFEMPPAPSKYTPPATGKKNLKNLWYSFDQGPIHWVMMSTEHDFLPSSVQYNFIKADLAAVNRSETPFVVFMGHRPMYTTENPQDSLSEHMRTSLEPLFQTYKVNLALWGHVHKYERTCAITFNGTCAQGDEFGTVHAVIGNAGNTYQGEWASEAPHHYVVPEWLVFRTFSWGISYLTASKDQLLFTARGYKVNGVHDQFALQPATL